ncbi:DNA polymerase/3'-5' exonuclease PolX [Thermanaerosceptrum fracticalcis]|uniref:DNA polymerase/3'-5' exonuclease PolX n=1 Tax=Thermanaerosceptrum fracticalcis TaxID=1712410 RepID=A0A7G6DZL6_THEFR|nr:DNA polymerase/3'-5' exonuclease PolX [Thermanaerosceptrum fracticalcis]
MERNLVTKDQIADVLREIGVYLELTEDSPYKALAYKRAARTLLHWPHRKLPEDLGDIPGIGEKIAGTIREIQEKGESEQLDRLKKKVPPQILPLLRLPDIGTKVLRILIKEGYTDIAQVVEGARNRQIRKLPGLGAKTEKALLKGIEILEKGLEVMPIALAWPLAHELITILQEWPEVNKIALAGELRRGVEQVRSIDIILNLTTDSERLVQRLPSLNLFKEIKEQDKGKVFFETHFGVDVNLYTVPEEEWGYWLVYFTGSEVHFQRLEKLLPPEKKEFKQEREVYQSAGLPFIDPEVRETGEEISRVKEEGIRLVSDQDIKGDLHCHSTWSDGGSDIAELVSMAQQMGYEYLVITDHSQSLKIAGGLSQERLMAQRAEIEKIRGRLNNFTLLHGVEVDILKDGRLDYPDEILAGMDLVIASVHSHFRLDRYTMTERVSLALKNPHVDILAHPTGRLIGMRQPYELDVEAIIDLAAVTGTYLELNSSPDRLDLSPPYLEMAKARGVRICINTDAHNKDRLRDINLGVKTARRGWLSPEDIVNTRTSTDLLKLLEKRQ